jgi:uncharacterized protein (DUF427 family)
MSIASSVRRALGGNLAKQGTPVRAVWNDTVIAESDRTVVVEGNHYFPPDAIRREHLEASDHSSVCPWKGVASYSDIVVDGERNAGAAWHYQAPRAAAAQIADHLAFWRGVRVEPVLND